MISRTKGKSTKGKPGSKSHLKKRKSAGKYVEHTCVLRVLDRPGQRPDTR